MLEGHYGGVRGVLWADRDCRYSGARRGIGAFGDPRGVGAILGVSGVYWGWQGL